ncbi:hypothetical protein [Paenibacillus ginsengihumi]|uniref:hypothetical protein n=1 Tax=Paenibacillus ginsengihumi TaxID=431596 RepID=UPI00037526B7|nr:hypothetical protein [Paenibacillus ginsengihumi]
MSYYYYAEIQSGRVVSVSQLVSIMVPINTQDTRLLGCKYIDGEFVGYKTILTVDKTEIVADGADEATVAIMIKTWDDQPSMYSGDVELDVAGKKLTVHAVDGSATYTFTADKAGTYTIRCTGPDFTAYGAVAVEATEVPEESQPEETDTASEE